MLIKKIHVCVIDDGICADEINIYKNIQIRNGKAVSSLNVCKNNSHGTGCAKVITKRAEKDILISSVSILNRQCKGNIQSLCTAFAWCVENDVDIINLSLGSVFFRDKELLLSAVNRCAENGIVIVGATSNEGYVTYPASFTNVLGVRSFDEKEKRGCVARYDTNLGFGLFETQGSEKIYINGMEKTTSWCNSVAAPQITAKIINVYEEGISPIAIRNMFGNELLKINCFGIDWASKAYAQNIHELIPKWCVCKIINKEMETSLDIADTVITQKADNIKRWLEAGKNIIYIGDDVIDYESSNSYVWSKYNRIQQIHYNQIAQQGISEVPVIFIEGVCALKYIYGLEKMFREKDYHAYSISHSILYELYGITYIPTEIMDADKVNNFIRNELYYKQGDILLYDISGIDEKSAAKNTKLSPDIIIDTTEKNVTISSEYGSRTVADSIESVGNYIIELLEGEGRENDEQ
jgi:hypothetical protein